MFPHPWFQFAFHLHKVLVNFLDSRFYCHQLQFLATEGNPQSSHIHLWRINMKARYSMDTWIFIKTCHCHLMLEEAPFQDHTSPLNQFCNNLSGKIIQFLFLFFWSLYGQVVMAPSWGSQGCGFKSRHLQVTFDPKLPHQQRSQCVSNNNNVSKAYYRSTRSFTLFFALQYFSLLQFKVVSNSSPKQAAAVFTPATVISRQYFTLFWDVQYFLVSILLIQSLLYFCI